jgi:hypothetical protein
MPGPLMALFTPSNLETGGGPRPLSIVVDRH